MNYYDFTNRPIVFLQTSTMVTAALEFLNAQSDDIMLDEL